MISRRTLLKTSAAAALLPLVARAAEAQAESRLIYSRLFNPAARKAVAKAKSGSPATAAPCSWSLTLRLGGPKRCARA